MTTYLFIRFLLPKLLPARKAERLAMEEWLCTWTRRRVPDEVAVLRRVQVLRRRAGLGPFQFPKL